MEKANHPKVVIDGGSLCDLDTKTGFLALYTLLHILEKEETSYVCIFHKGVRTRILHQRKVFGQAYAELLETRPGKVIQEKTQPAAHERMLHIAGQFNIPIITNDPLKSYYHRFEWLSGETGRLLTASVSEKRLLVPGLPLEAPLIDLDGSPLERQPGDTRHAATPKKNTARPVCPCCGQPLP